jgi:hypothetical protein
MLLLFGVFIKRECSFKYNNVTYYGHAFMTLSVIEFLFFMKRVQQLISIPVTPESQEITQVSKRTICSLEPVKAQPRASSFSRSLAPSAPPTARPCSDSASAPRQLPTTGQKIDLL